MTKSTKPNPLMTTLGSLGAALVLVILVLTFTGVSDLSRGVIRAAALMAYLCTFMASFSSMFMREITKRLGQPFMKVHHTWVIAGIVGMLVHATTFAWYVGSVSVFVPRFDSLEVFLRNGGRPALILFVITSLTAVFRAAIGKNWRVLHWLNYLAFFLATGHAWLIGSSFESWILKIMSALMATALLAAFIIKRTRKPKSKRLKG
ncbi:MAG TPA: hypothetical protein P5195_08395 [Anaerolineae bacterium]|nr:hypothetical protein [Anaerolineae bacterium]